MQRIVSILGVDYQYTPLGWVTRPVRAEFSAPPVEYMGVEGFRPSVSVLAADVPEAQAGDTWLIDGITYRGLVPKLDAVSGLIEIPLEVVED